jgi:hypothetical protein
MTIADGIAGTQRTFAASARPRPREKPMLPETRWQATIAGMAGRACVIGDDASCASRSIVRPAKKVSPSPALPQGSATHGVRAHAIPTTSMYGLRIRAFSLP